MKVKLVILASLAMLGFSTYLVTSLFAQQPGGGAAPAASAAPNAVKLGLVNMAAILKGYNKVKVYKDQMDKWREPYDTTDKQWRKYITDTQAFASKDGATQAQREEAEKNILVGKHKLEENQQEANKVLAKKGEEQMVQMYKEFEAAVQRYAQANGFHMIFHYSEPLTNDDKYVAPNIQRKLVNPANAGSVCPVYWASGLDVTGDVLATLNTMYPVTAGAPAAAPPAGSPAGGSPQK